LDISRYYQVVGKPNIKQSQKTKEIFLEREKEAKSISAIKN